MKGGDPIGGADYKVGLTSSSQIDIGDTKVSIVSGEIPI